MFSRILLCLSTVLLLSAATITFRTVFFLRRAIPIQGVVVANEYYRGPPRSARSFHLAVRYEVPGSIGMVDAEIAAPFLRKFSQDDKIPLLVDPRSPASPRMPYLSELWAWPLSLFVFGAGLLAVSFAVRPRIARNVSGAE